MEMKKTLTNKTSIIIMILPTRPDLTLSLVRSWVSDLIYPFPKHAASTRHLQQEAKLL
jgi:hypothetical protein